MPLLLAQPNYPQSLDVVLQYSQVQNHISNTYQLVAKTELATEPDKKGKHDQKYATKWKLPDCQFFQEHSPASWEYALVFVPYYEPPPRRKNRKQRKDPPTDKGPQQDPIEVKLDFQWAHGAPSC
ncbi:uncharacterized protein BYT42DRAFT_582517 [Radiomyces spectabilis]|uniref:uncharacterized protein n=1 Tax=Radiomyces spectabilis TaxID=64574 RepID=UPI00221E74F0|nr:uncharacterized protein BYT42DRAFT_582517 [Radiomyces spectabilis]KAI8370462.1 hypothetical protein BYT42DRAFT_582517 [Radiomyces spectabilis]